MNQKLYSILQKQMTTDITLVGCNLITLYFISMFVSKPTEHLQWKLDTPGGAAHFRPFDCRRKRKYFFYSSLLL